MPNSLFENQYSSRRAHPRLPLATPIELHFGGTTILGHTENISLGGLLASCEKKVPAPGTELILLFNLPNGTSIHTAGLVRRTQGERVGVQFKSLPSQIEEALDAFTRRMGGISRHGERKQRRLHLTLHDVRRENEEQIAETVVLSRKGGLLICRALFQVGDCLELYWPDKKKKTEIVVVFRKEVGTGGLAELGFEFLDGGNFWGLDF